MVQPKKNPQDSINGDNSKELYNMSHRSKDMTGSGSGNSGKSSNKTNGTSSNFRTDSAITANHTRGERTLQRWVAPTGPNDVDMSLEGSSNGGGGQWDQFAANEKKFGITTDYDERFYTTAIDKNNPEFKARYAKAEKIAKEIERSAPTTSHQAEERKMDYAGGNDVGGDEEDKYSGVKRQDPPAGNRENKYMPPAKRAPAGASTVKGAPVDPAIISSQLRTSKHQSTPRQEENKTQATPSLEPSSSTSAVSASQTAALLPESKPESVQKLTDIKATSQTSTPLKPSTATSRTISPQANGAQGTVPSATSTVTEDVLKEFKHFATVQRANADKIRVNKAKADKEVKLSELKRFADNFKLPTPVPSDLIGIIAKDPAKQREIQEKAQRDANEIAKRKADEAAAKDRKGSASKESQVNAASAAPSENRNPRPANNASTNGPQSGSRNQASRMVPPYPQFQNNRPNPSHMGPLGRQGGLTHRLRESQHKSQGQEARVPPTGPANPANAPFPHRMGGPTGHLGTKFNPNSHEFRPNAFAPSFSPNRHTSAGSSPRSAINNTTDAHAPGAAQTNMTIVISKKKRTVDPKKCSILAFAKSVQPPEGKNWSDNGDLRPAYDTLPTWRSATDNEKPDSTMLLDCKEYFERQPFNTQPTPNPHHLHPQHVPHQHQLPLHMQHNVGPRHSPHAPHVQLHGGQHNPVPHTPFNGADDHRMIHSNSQSSYTQSPRIGHQIPLGYPTTMHSTPQMPYGQHMMGGAFMGPGGPQMNNFSNRSLSSSGQYMPQQPGTMGAPMMMQQQFMNPGMMGGPHQMPMYPTGQPFIPPGAAQSMPAGANGYPSPRPSAPMMVHQGSQQGQAMYGQSPNMSYQQPYAPQQGQMNNIRPSYNGASAQHYGSSPQQMHQYSGPPHRNGNNNFNKSYQGHGQHHGPNNHVAPTGPQGRTSDGTDEAK